MPLVTTTPANPLEVARSRWDEATRVSSAFKIQRDVRERRAWQLQGQPGELEAWARVQEAEDQLKEAEALEVKAWADVAWQEKAQADARLAQRLRRNGGRSGR